MEELNKKLAIWRGFKQEGSLKKGYHLLAGGKREINWVTPLGYSSIGGILRRDWGSLPLFYRSLDVCFEWLVPEAIKKIMAEQECGKELACEILFKKWQQEGFDAPALCKAIEKLIDGAK